MNDIDAQLDALKKYVAEQEAALAESERLRQLAVNTAQEYKERLDARIRAHERCIEDVLRLTAERDELAAQLQQTGKEFVEYRKAHPSEFSLFRQKLMEEAVNSLSLPVTVVIKDGRVTITQGE